MIKWKIFKLANFVHIITLIAFIGLSTYYNYNRKEFILSFFFGLVFFSPALVNCLLNISLFKNYHQQTLPVKAKRIAFWILFVLFAGTELLLNYFLLTYFIKGFNQTYNNSTPAEFIIRISLLISKFIVGIYILIFQVPFFNRVKAAYRSHQEKLLSGIGITD